MGGLSVTMVSIDIDCLDLTSFLPADQHMWRWTGFNSGLDLIITYDKYRLSMKRNMESDHEALTSTQKKRHIAFRFGYFFL